MSDTAAAQLRRMLHMIPRLADGAEHDVATVARELGTTTDELLRDLYSLCLRYDDPPGFVQGVQVFVDGRAVSVTTNHLRRPMRLTMPELCALELGLQLLRRERTPDEHAAIERALARLRATISTLPANDRHDGLRSAELATAGSPEHLTLLRAAVIAHRKVRLRYRAGAAVESGDRTVCPHALVFAEQMWYVVALCDDTRVRFFRLDRIEEVEPLDDTFEPVSGAVAELANGKAFVSESARTMTVRYSPRVARWIAEREGVPLGADGSLVMEHRVADDAWAVRHVLQYGADAELVAPADLRAEVSARLASLLADGAAD